MIKKSIKGGFESQSLFQVIIPLVALLVRGWFKFSRGEREVPQLRLSECWRDGRTGSRLDGAFTLVPAFLPSHQP